MIAKGTFNVSLEPTKTLKDFNAPASLGRMTIDKQFNGDLEATSVGEMLSVRISDTQSAGYVALEQLSGTLNSISGGFVLQHYGVMAGSSSSLKLEIIPDSGTDGLQGISGTMSINIEGGQHYYELTYTLA